MKLSHSKLSLILSCPMSYYLKYIEGISPVTEKPALYIGSAVHWGIEHSTYNLTEFFGSTNDEYTRDQLLAESMVYGYLRHQYELYHQILTMPDGTPLQLEDEKHELFLTAELPSATKSKPHEFVGIIDLLLLTDQGFVIIDFKTSSSEPDWNKYLDQIYRYVYLINSVFPEVPVLKIGIINLRKTAIRQKKTENTEQFLHRMRQEYEINDNQYITYHEYDATEYNSKVISDYIANLSKMCDMAQLIDEQKMWYINYNDADGIYGKSPYWDIFYQTPDAYALYKIADEAFVHVEDDKTGIQKERCCVPIDMCVIDHNNVLNHYSKYKAEYATAGIKDFEKFHSYLKEKYITDDRLLAQYKINTENNI